MKTAIHFLLTLTISVYILSIMGCKTDPPSQTQLTHTLQISRHSTAQLTNNRADQILNRMGTILQIKDGAGDVACNVDFDRNGVTSFNLGNGVINSASDFSAVNNQPGNVKVVRQINWCGSLSPNIIGCAPVPGTSLVVVRFTDNQEGLLWVHEFGHNKSLGHDNRENAVMRPIINVNNTYVNESECNSYKVQPSITAPSTQFIAATAASEENPQESQIMDIKEFVRQTFIHGVPYEEASKYSADDAKALNPMLADPAEEAHWANIVITMCIIGNETAVDAAISFIDKADEGTLSPAHYRAKTSAIMALGYAVNKTGNQQALNYLTENSRSTDVWSVKDMKWSSPFQASVGERNLELSTMAILGLALAGTEEAVKALQVLQDSTTSKAGEEFQQLVSSIVSDAIKTNQEISETGLMEYYRKKQN